MILEDVMEENLYQSLSIHVIFNSKVESVLGESVYHNEDCSADFAINNQWWQASDEVH